MNTHMVDWPVIRNADTQFAPAARENMRMVRQQAALIDQNRIGQAILDSISDIAIVLNDKRQIVAANQHLLNLVGAANTDGVLGLRPGEAVRCIHAQDSPGGCGTGEACRQCGAVKAILTSLLTEKTVEREALITIRGEKGSLPLEFHTKANFLSVAGQRFVLLLLNDISDKKRKLVADRIIFGEVLSTLAEITEVLGQRQDELAYSLLQRLRGRSVYATAQLCLYRDISLAEAGRLTPDITAFNLSELVNGVLESASARFPEIPMKLELNVPNTLTLDTDRLLLWHSISNLFTNALEASEAPDTVDINVSSQDQQIRISVHSNPPMPRAVQSQIFVRSFTTKKQPGRGLGTYSARVFVERYLGGKVSFHSEEDSGTTFQTEIPAQLD